MEESVYNPTRKRVLLVIALLLVTSMLSACAHSHTWTEATCTEPKTCSGCGETEGEALGHLWTEATCTEPKTCSRCGETEGEPLGHLPQGATCTEAAICSRCGETVGEPLGHDVPELSCTDGGVCTRCGAEIEALGHDWVEATCTKPKTCSRCGETEGKALGHTPMDAVTEPKKEATCTMGGSYREVIYCSVCHEEISHKTIATKALGHTTKNGVCTRCGAESYQKVSGKGDDVYSGIKVGNGLYKVHFTYSGKSNFAVWVHYANGTRDLAVNEIGKYDGYYYLYGKAPYTFEIEAKGKWTYKIEKLKTTTEKSFKGTGCFVTDVFTAKTGTWHIKHNGKSNFAVWLYTTDGRDLIVNEIGKYDGKRLLSIPSGSDAILVIEADGSWSISPA